MNFKFIISQKLEKTLYGHVLLLVRCKLYTNERKNSTKEGWL